MIEETGAIDVYFEDTIEVLVEEPDEFPLTSLRKVLEEKEIEFSEVERSFL